MYLDIDSSITGLGYDIIEIGCCKIVRHKQWKTFAFLGTAFTNAPLDEIKIIIQEY